jgi:hypothetical protein
MQISTEFRWRRPGQTRGAIGLSLIFCFFCIKAKEEVKTNRSPNQKKIPLIQSNTQLPKAFGKLSLIFLLSLHQGKRRGKNKQITKSEKIPANPGKHAITESIRKVVLDFLLLLHQGKRRGKKK